jgi:hypothetical protein
MAPNLDLRGHRRLLGIGEVGVADTPRYGLAARLVQPDHPLATPCAALSGAQRGDIERARQIAAAGSRCE